MAYKSKVWLTNQRYRDSVKMTIVIFPEESIIKE